MSVQETKLAAIADAIREKDGTTAPISANDFPARIRAISTVPEGLRTITVEASDPAGGTVSGGGMASDGMTLTVQAVVAAGYEFGGWQEGGNTVSMDATYTFEVTADKALTAAFEECSPYTPGVDWWDTSLPQYEYWTASTYGGGKFVAIAYDSKVAAYSEDGITWSPTELPAKQQWKSVTYGGGKFVAVANWVEQIAYSENGIDWQLSSVPKGHWCDVAYGNGKFIVIQPNALTFLQSENGVDWESVPLQSTAEWASITYGDGKFVVISGGEVKNSDVVLCSTDGITWETHKLPDSTGWNCVAYGNGKFVAIGYRGTKTAYSTDGTTWALGNPLSYDYWEAATYGNGRFVALSLDSVAYSTDGISWDEVAITQANWRSVSYSGETFAAVAYQGAKAMYSNKSGPPSNP